MAETPKDSPLTLTDFLLARIAEDELAASLVHSSVAEYHVGWTGDGMFSPDSAQLGALWNGDRVMADCASKRRIVENCDGAMESGDDGEGNLMTSGANLGNEVLRELATAYADHSDYRDEWKS